MKLSITIYHCYLVFLSISFGADRVNIEVKGESVDRWVQGTKFPPVPVADIRGRTDLSAVKNAVVLIHGWNPEGVARRLEWSTEWKLLTANLLGKLDDSDPSKSWSVLRCDWSAAAATGLLFGNGVRIGVNATESASNASRMGIEYARNLNEKMKNLRRIQFIVHSAGTWMAKEAIEELVHLNPLVTIQLTMLDPFIPADLVAGGNPVFSRTAISNLVSIERLWSVQNIFADDGVNYNFLRSKYPVPATQPDFGFSLSIDHWRIDRDAPNKNGAPYDYHSGPILYYSDTIAAIQKFSFSHPELSTVENWPARGANSAFWNVENAFPRINASGPTSITGSVGTLAALKTDGVMGLGDIYKWYRLTTFISGQDQRGIGRFKSMLSSTIISNTPQLDLPIVAGMSREEYVCEASFLGRKTYSEIFTVSSRTTSPQLVAPSIASVTPATLTIQSSAPLSFSIQGSNFITSPSTSLQLTSQTGAVSTPVFTVKSSSEITCSAILASPGKWTIIAKNGSESSAPFYFWATSTVPTTPPKVLSRISIENLPSSLFEGQTASNAGLRAYYSDGTDKPLSGLTADNWQVQYSALVFAAPRTFTAAQVDANRTVNVTAFYTEGGVAKTAQTQITILNNTSSGGVVTGEIVKNGNFASDGAFWTTNNADFRISSNFSWGGHPGGYAWLGTSTGAQGNNLAGAISQTIDLPSNATALTLSFSAAISLSNAGAPTTNDELTVDVRNEDNTGNVRLLQINPVSHPSAVAAWTTFTVNLLPYKGTRKMLVFGGRTDSSNPATLRVDDVVVQVVSATPTLIDLAISGPDTVREGAQSQYQALASLSTGTSSNVTTATTWSVNENAAITNGNLTANQVTGQKTARISASYVSGGITRSVTKDVTILDSAPVPIELAVYGPSEVDENSGGTFSAVLKLSNGVYRDVTGEAYWTFTGSGGQVDYSGRLFTNEVLADSDLTVKAEYSQDDVTVSGQVPLTIKDRLPPALPASIVIFGPGTVDEAGTGLFDTEVTFADGTKKFLTPVWGENSRFTTISEHGVLICEEVLTSQTVTLTASYTFNSATVTTTKVVTITNTRDSSAKPEITMPSAVEVPVDRILNLRLQTAHPIVSASATGLPTGLTFNSATFEIQGTPTDIGTWEVALTASNDFGSTAGILLLTVTEDAGPEWIRFKKADPVASPVFGISADGEGGSYLYGTSNVSHRTAAGVIDLNLSFPGVQIVQVSGSAAGFAITGRFDATVTVAGRTLEKFPNGQGQAFVMAFNKSGQGLWHQTARSSSKNVNAAAVAMNPDGSLFWGVNYFADVDFSTLGVGLYRVSGSTGLSMDCAVMKIEQNGAFAFGSYWGGSLQDELREILPVSSGSCRVKIESLSTSMERKSMQYPDVAGYTWNKPSSAYGMWVVDNAFQRGGYSEGQFNMPDGYVSALALDPVNPSGTWTSGAFSSNQANFTKDNNGVLIPTAFPEGVSGSKSGFLLKFGSGSLPAKVATFKSNSASIPLGNKVDIRGLAPISDGRLISVGTYGPEMIAAGTTYLSNPQDNGLFPTKERTFIAGHSADNQIRWALDFGGVDGGQIYGLKQTGIDRWVMLCSCSGAAKFGRLPVIAAGGWVVVDIEMKQPQLEAPQTYERWLSGGLSAGELAAVRVGGIAEDLNQNERSDLLDYAFGATTAFDATSSEPVTSFVVEPDATKHLAITFDRAFARSDVKLAVELSNDLKVWSVGSVYVAGADITDTVLTKEVSRVNMGAFERITVSEKRDAVGARYMRIKATTGPAPVPSTGLLPPVLPNYLFNDEFDSGFLDSSKWTVDAGATVVISDGVAILTSNPNWSRGFSSAGKASFQRNKLVIEWRMKRDDIFDSTLLVGDGATNYVLFMDTAYSGTVAPGMRITKNGAFGSGDVSTGSPTTEWMEYRATLEGTGVTLQRGPTLDTITQTLTSTLSASISNYNLFFWFTNGGNNTAQFDWIRVK